VVAFDATGLPDFVGHQETGYLAAPEDPKDLARGIAWVLADHERRALLGAEARKRAVHRWSPPVVASAHLDVYARILEGVDSTVSTPRLAP
jgi:glycosyltransferase involved in cell wall biosynthesis